MAGVQGGMSKVDLDISEEDLERKVERTGELQPPMARAAVAGANVCFGQGDHKDVTCSLPRMEGMIQERCPGQDDLLQVQMSQGDHQSSFHFSPRQSEAAHVQLRRRLSWWEKAGAPSKVLSYIVQGVEPQWASPSLRLQAQPRSAQQEALAMQVLGEYMQVGAVQEVSPHMSKYWVPWFVIAKKEDNGKEKLRLIADCRVINQFLQPKKFTLDHWQKIFPLLRKDMWATKVDLKNAYFHLALSEKLRPYVHLNVG